MSQNARESLSALMDNEGDELELRRVLKALEASPDAAEAWRRYHLMRSLMRREPDIDVATDLSAGIMARLKDEQPPQMDAPAPTTRRSLPFARSAGIAAAVSLMVITGVQFYGGGGSDGTQPSVAGGSAAQPAPASLAAGESAARPSLVDLPLFQLPQGAGQGLMTVGAGADAPPHVHGAGAAPVAAHRRGAGPPAAVLPGSPRRGGRLPQRRYLDAAAARLRRRRPRSALSAAG